MQATGVSNSTQTAKRTYSIPEAARIIGIGKNRAYEMAHDGTMPGLLKVGNRYMVSRKALDAFVDGEFEGSAA